jgi:DNA mismatch repair protein PMS2
MGAESIVVSDNGSGISPSNYESVALKHFTSKISAFEDLTSLWSFGFRGEALSAICEISRHVGCTTRQIDQELGKALVFGRNGA